MLDLIIGKIYFYDENHLKYGDVLLTRVGIF